MLDFPRRNTKSRPTLLHVRSSNAFAITTVATAVFTDVFTYAVVVPVIPFALETRLHVDVADTQKWTSIFLAVYAAAMLFASPICGWVADQMSSRRTLMLIGLTALVASTVVLCVGRSIPVLMLGRLLQGFSAAVVWSAGLALLVDTMGTEGIGMALGYVGTSMTLASLSAPTIGGVVFAKAGYYAVFAVVFGLIAIDIVLRLFMIESKVAIQWLQPSAATEISSDTGNTDAIPINKDEKSPSTIVVQTLEVNTVIEPCHEVTTPQTKSSRRLPPIILLLRSKRLLTALWCCSITAMAYTIFDTTLPLFVADTFHWDALGAGLIFIPIAITSLLGPVTGALSDKHGPRWLAVTGSLAACPCLILLRLVSHNSIHHKVLLCALLTLLGMFLDLVIVPTMADISYAIEEKARRRPAGYYGRNGAYAQGYSLFNLAWSAGSMLGPLWGGVVQERMGWGTTTLCLGCLMIGVAVPALLWTGGRLFDRTKKRNSSDVAAVA